MEHNYNNKIDMKFDLCEKAVREVQNSFDYLIQDMNIIRNCLKERNSPVDQQLFVQRLEFIVHLAQSTQLDLEANSYASMLHYRALATDVKAYNMRDWRQSLDQANYNIEMETPALLMRRFSSLSLNEKSKNIGITNEAFEYEKLKNTKNKIMTINRNYTLNTYSIINSVRFAENAILNATVTFIENLDELIFYVCTLYNPEIIELSRNLNLPPLSCLPTKREYFGISTEENTIMRAVCEDTHAEPLYVSLIDFGEVVELQNDFKLYKLPDKFQNIPPQAIKCQLIGLRNDKQEIKQNKQLLMETLKKSEYGNVSLKIMKKSENMLLVEYLEKAATPAPKPAYSGNPFSLDEFDEDEDTSSNDIEDMNLKNVSKTMTVNVTHIRNAVSFYAQCPLGENEKSGKVCWSDENVQDKQKLRKYPKVGDLVLAQYAEDTFWYRARVQKVNEKSNQITVFFVDFGNEEQVPLCSVATILASQLNYNFRAQLFKLANVEEYAVNDAKNHQVVMDAMRALLVNSEVELKILHMNGNEAIVVELLDKDLIKSVDELVEEKLLKRIP